MGAVRGFCPSERIMNGIVRSLRVSREYVSAVESAMFSLLESDEMAVKAQRRPGTVI